MQCTCANVDFEIDRESTASPVDKASIAIGCFMFVMMSIIALRLLHRRRPDDALRLDASARRAAPAPAPQIVILQR